MPGATFLSLPWHFMTEDLQRNMSWTSSEKAAPFLQLREILHKTADWRRTHFAVLNQASLDKVSSFYEKWTNESLVVPRTLVLFESRLLEASRSHEECRHHDEG